MSTGAEHGGAFWDAIGADFKHLDRRSSVINADVLDAWFPPSPQVIEALKAPEAWLFQTSPPTDAEGLMEAVCAARSVARENVVLGAGSSDLIFRAFLMALDGSSRALVPDPTYGEYAHVLEKVVGCQVDRMPLSDWQVDLESAAARLNSEHYELFVLVNPNSPTGHTHSREAVSGFLSSVPERTLIWIDEAYAEYAGVTCETLVAGSPNLVVCKSMSKVYSLSGLRVAYLVGARSFAERIRLRTPPWVVSLPGQIAAVAALGDPAYYLGRFEETRQLRSELALSLRGIGGEVMEGDTNFVLWLLPEEMDARALAERCKAHGLFLRLADSIGAGLGNALRVSVKASDVQDRLIRIIRSELNG
jgi:histidinol-phosphate/aromatic aminotransferase/cobyric acid decarboxylase-like protein